ncbi:hypothetical protein RE9425_03500 [Prescottella equi]|nr:hypothetical protein RE9425_03500 [Prescottella equi]
MTDLERQLGQVWNPDIRPLVDEAVRCYNSGAMRASIAATWTAITADIITKLIHLADDGDGGAVEFRTGVTNAQAKGLTPDGVREMQAIESRLLEDAERFELIDSIERRELERVREDRNLCVHPSLSNFNEAYTPHPEVARGHLSLALDKLLVHPPTQGKNILDAYVSFTCDPAFVAATAHIQATFFDRVRAAARGNIAALAAKHAVCELPVDGMSAAELADRSASVLFAFALRDRELVSSAIAKQRERFRQREGAVQLRALIRLGDQDFFWDIVDDPLAERLNELVSRDFTSPQGQPLHDGSAASIAMVSSRFARDRLPKLEERFKELDGAQQMSVVATRTAEYFVPDVLRFIENARNFRVGEQAGHLLVQYAQVLTALDLKNALQLWAGNDQCRNASQMPELAVTLFRRTTHVGSEHQPIFAQFLNQVQMTAAPDDSYYRYPELEAALRVARHTGAV